ncbi:hypothetical protein CALCODRAFT_65011 [Calocera cornea HHB12733]|uniref:F-box domain-containing protein n=1 Tax=Calocera cornea HHB12733 TaxID=1353952 RepID=A0A165DL60_9BASI|nr:hypothetical protein CALCODRAFT_65011 [Calocera cornea HHB12733]
MASATIESLPNELLVQIIRTNSLDVTDILRCSRLNSRFHSIVTSTVEIQYRLLLLQSGLVNNNAISSEILPFSKRFALLRAHRAAMDRLHPTRCMPIPVRMPPGYVPGSTYELVDGIYARGIKLDILTNAITFVILPSVVLGIHEPKDWTVNLGMTIHDFGIEPLMDLLVVVEAERQPQPHSPAVFPVHFLTIREGKPHPDARLPYVEFLIPNATHIVDFQEYLFIIHMCGDLVGVLFRPRIFEKAHHLVIWNWRTGAHICTYTAPSPICIASFAFLDARHILLAASHEPVSEFTFDVLRIDEEPFIEYCFHPPELEVGLNLPPPILRSSPCRVPHSGNLIAKPILPPLPFYCDLSPEYRVFSLSLEFLFEVWAQTVPQRVIGAKRYTLFAPASLFLNPAPGLIPSTVSTTHIPWSWWAQRARWLDCSADPTNSHVCHTFGMRHVRWATRTRSPLPSSSSDGTSPPATPPLLTPSPPTSPCVQVLTFPPPSLPIQPSEYITLAPRVTSFDATPIFAEEVESELPFTVHTARDRMVGLEDCEGLCVDGFERIIGLDARDESDEDETLTVCVF